MQRIRSAAAAALIFALCLVAQAARAEADGFHLGDGHHGSLTVGVANTVINTYAPVSVPVAAGDTLVAIGASSGGVEGFAPGDLVMLWQATGLVPEPASGQPGPFDLGTDGVGHWELARVAAVTPSALTLTAPLLAAFPADATQVVRLPEYTTLTFGSTGSVRPLPWNGSVGGIVAALVQGTVNLSTAKAFAANGTGLRGGNYVDDASGAMGCTGLDEPAAAGAQKGEGVAATRFGVAQTGRGNVANGGGGGACYHSGGGGGGNGGSGGQGGYSDGYLDGSRAAGGLGGAALAAPLPQAALLMGGGGGAGHGDSGGNGQGGRGGGVVFLRAGSIVGSGGVLQAAGASAPAVATGDAAGGGGAGGTIHLRVAGSASCNALQAPGGVGGNAQGMRVGPGGGGGGGRVLLQSAGGSCNPQILGASAGVQADMTAPGGLAYGALSGGTGIATVLPGGYAQAAAPVVHTPANGSYVGNPTPVVTGSGAQASRGVALFVDGALQLVTTADGAGTFSATIPTALGTGVHQVQAAVYDQGDLGLRSAPTSFTIDTTPPPAPVLLTPANGSVGNDNRPTFAGTAEANSMVTTYIDGGIAGTVAASVGGDWAFTPSTALADGAHTVKASATDAAGNTSPYSAPHTFTIDTTPPPAPVLATPADSSTTNANQPAISGTAEPASLVAVSVDGAVVGTATADAAGHWSFTPATALADGAHTVKASATDAAGNTSPDSAPHMFTIDTTPPPAPVLATPADGSVTLDNRPAVSGTAEPGSTVTVLVDGSAIGSTSADAAGQWLFAMPAPLADGLHTARARATDVAGNTSVDSASHAFTVLANDRVFADGFEQP
ncbi:MAG: hypothetical protein GXC76_03410 [Rhodanobacteraceae bacterium]|jgi:hypothetical protein|nr:hypothetical protein [Rhodanobacteraceae bacterium]